MYSQTLEPEVYTQNNPPTLPQAYQRRTVYNLCKITTRMEPKSSFFKRIVIGGIYRTLSNNSRNQEVSWNLPVGHLVELGMICYV